MRNIRQNRLFRFARLLPLRQLGKYKRVLFFLIVNQVIASEISPSLFKAVLSIANDKSTLGKQKWAIAKVDTSNETLFGNEL